jgi:hypothetical protein
VTKKRKVVKAETLDDFAKGRFLPKRKASQQKIINFLDEDEVDDDDDE